MSSQKSKGTPQTSNASPNSGRVSGQISPPLSRQANTTTPPSRPASSKVMTSGDLRKQLKMQQARPHTARQNTAQSSAPSLSNLHLPSQRLKPPELHPITAIPKIQPDSKIGNQVVGVATNQAATDSILLQQASVLRKKSNIQLHAVGTSHTKTALDISASRAKPKPRQSIASVSLPVYEDRPPSSTMSPELESIETPKTMPRRRRSNSVTSRTDQSPQSKNSPAVEKGRKVSVVSLKQYTDPSADDSPVREVLVIADTTPTVTPTLDVEQKTSTSLRSSPRLAKIKKAEESSTVSSKQSQNDDQTLDLTPSPEVSPPKPRRSTRSSTRLSQPVTVDPDQVTEMIDLETPQPEYTKSSPKLTKTVLLDDDVVADEVVQPVTSPKKGKKGRRRSSRTNDEDISMNKEMTVEPAYISVESHSPISIASSSPIVISLDSSLQNSGALESPVPSPPRRGRPPKNLQQKVIIVDTLAKKKKKKAVQEEGTDSVDLVKQEESEYMLKDENEVIMETRQSPIKISPDASISTPPSTRSLRARPQRRSTQKKSETDSDQNSSDSSSSASLSDEEDSDYSTVGKKKGGRKSTSSQSVVSPRKSPQATKVSRKRTIEADDIDSTPLPPKRIINTDDDEQPPEIVPEEAAVPSPSPKKKRGRNPKTRPPPEPEISPSDSFIIPPTQPVFETEPNPLNQPPSHPKRVVSSFQADRVSELTESGLSESQAPMRAVSETGGKERVRKRRNAGFINLLEESSDRPSSTPRPASFLQQIQQIVTSHRRPFDILENIPSSQMPHPEGTPTRRTRSTSPSLALFHQMSQTPTDTSGLASEIATTQNTKNALLSFIRTQITTSQRQPVPSLSHIPHSGLNNMGNTCYVNSVLQCFSTLRPFLNSIINATQTHPTPNAFVPLIFTLFCLLFPSFKSGTSGFTPSSYSSPSISPLLILKQIQMKLNFEPGLQQDAHEFTRAMLDMLKDEWKEFEEKEEERERMEMDRMREEENNEIDGISPNHPKSPNDSIQPTFAPITHIPLYSHTPSVFANTPQQFNRTPAQLRHILNSPTHPIILTSHLSSLPLNTSFPLRTRSVFDSLSNLDGKADVVEGAQLFIRHVDVSEQHKWKLSAPSMFLSRSVPQFHPDKLPNNGNRSKFNRQPNISSFYTSLRTLTTELPEEGPIDMGQSMFLPLSSTSSIPSISGPSTMSPPPAPLSDVDEGKRRTSPVLSTASHKPLFAALPLIPTVPLQSLENKEKAETDPITPIFSGETLTTITCLCCNNALKSKQEFSDLALPLRPTFEECLLSIAEKEWLNNKNKLQCVKCKAKTEAIQKTAFEQLPPVLAVSLSRFTFSETRMKLDKVTEPCSLPVVFEIDDSLKSAGLKDLMCREWDTRLLAGVDRPKAHRTVHFATSSDSSDTENDTPIAHPRITTGIYALSGFVCHVGGQPSQGHYTAYVRLDDANRVLDDEERIREEYERLCRELKVLKAQKRKEKKMKEKEKKEEEEIDEDPFSDTDETNTETDETKDEADRLPHFLSKMVEQEEEHEGMKLAKERREKAKQHKIVWMENGWIEKMERLKEREGKRMKKKGIVKDETDDSLDETQEITKKKRGRPTKASSSTSKSTSSTPKYKQTLLQFSRPSTPSGLPRQLTRSFFFSSSAYDASLHTLSPSSSLLSFPLHSTPIPALPPSPTQTEIQTILPSPTITSKQLIVSIIEHSEASWMLCDDATTTRLKPAQIQLVLDPKKSQTKTPYLLFYSEIQPTDVFVRVWRELEREQRRKG
ncbi:putative Ubiquitin carboxyl-terminal hydrolase [Blattamonas nauphoetae]|uniref:Ubiquitin carboxyl-terminal hydrolase n=1 Tax=Blattamonas nauphoetae TaxID=2049346 RepID=A0ABQ9Y710_9EUKA|nr:putative Ubiquitin carboxyl-terminal hydrolase [Blattamonas nauphoetae]